MYLFNPLTIQVKNLKYKENLMKLTNFVMVKFLKDTMVQPNDSEVREKKQTLKS